ncbi:hypothetical protein [Sediminitomix flava]|uniref:Spy/CpxP family protein refolding chaperone n=1 Tax=Sediminitomix flava TaxID=379075 RepID=A0A315ZFR0_SEDFL|nr:hypothetical protein [Sediminitomix flava]PWJ44351.1 Spy/CpxP family protein refolding chaperone [Sediminitomix flava]
MKKKFIVTLIGLASIFSTFVACAQRPNLDPKEAAERRTAQLTKALELTEEQGDKIYDLFFAQMEKMTELRESGADRSEIRAQMEEERESFESEMEKILTEEQFIAFKELAEEQKGKRGRGPRP